MTYRCPRCRRDALVDAYDEATGEYGYCCLVCELVVRDSDLPDEPPLTDFDRLEAMKFRLRTGGTLEAADIEWLKKIAEAEGVVRSNEPPLSAADWGRLKAQDAYKRLMRKWQDDMSQRDALSDDEVNRMADEAALDDLCESRGRR